MVDEYKNKVDFLTIYVSEAHPTDGWFVGTTHLVTQHQNETGRIAAAKMLVETVDLKCDVVIDVMTNKTAKSYGARIDRLYIIQNGRVAYQGGPGPHQYNLEEMEAALKSLL